MFIQVLALETRNLFVKCFDDAVENRGLYRVTVQAYERWAPLTSDPGSLGSTLQCFQYAEPSKVDVLTVAGGLDTPRDKWLRWQATESDVEGCIGLQDPQPLQPLVELSHKATSALTLMDALIAKGFAGQRFKTEHNNSAPLHFDERNVAGRVPYLQCVLLLHDVCRAGELAFPSGQPLAFYNLLLRTRNLQTPQHSLVNLVSMSKEPTGIV